MADERYLDINLLRTLEPLKRRRGRPGMTSVLLVLGLLLLVVEATCSREAGLERNRRLEEISARMEEVRAATEDLDQDRSEHRVRGLADRILWRHALVSLGDGLPRGHRIERLHYEKGALHLEIRGSGEETRARFVEDLVADSLFVRFFPDVGPPVPIADGAYSIACVREVRR